MKYLSSLVLSPAALAAALMATGGPAAAQSDTRLGVYVELRGGVTFLDNANNDPNGTAIFVTSPAESDFDTGGAFGGAIGYRFSDHGLWGRGFWNGFRTELEVSYNENDIDKVGGNPELGAFAYMANLYYDFDLGSYGFASLSKLTPYIGAGVGGAIVSVDGGSLLDDDDNVFAYQFRAGLQYAFTDRITGSVGYRYLATDDPRFRDGLGQAFETEYEGNTVEIGLRYDF